MRDWVRGHSVENLPESVRLFAYAEAMRWNHLPVAGGLYDQHPKLLDQWQIIFIEKAEFEKKQHQDEQRKAKSPGAQRRPSTRIAGRR